MHIISVFKLNLSLTQCFDSSLPKYPCDNRIRIIDKACFKPEGFLNVYFIFLLSDISTQILKHKTTFTSLSPENVLLPIFFKLCGYSL